MKLLIITILTLAQISSADWVRIKSSIVSDTSSLVVGPHRTGNAVATWTHPAWTAYIPGATWIWETTFAVDTGIDQTVTFHKDFYVPGTPVSGFLYIGSDNGFVAKLNGNQVACAQGGNDEPSFNLNKRQIVEVSLSLVNGINVLEVCVTNYAQPGGSSLSNPGGLLFKLVYSSEVLKD